MQTIYHRADSRGHADHGWLNSHHSFSFAGYYHPERMNFGVLRVLNDDLVAGGGGFPTHPHQNMEIVSIPLQGDLAHRDNMGHEQVIRQGDVQIMSAGTGVSHSEYNHSASDSVNFLQIWILPQTQNIQPRYQQKTFDPVARHNRFETVVSGDKADQSALWINQDARFLLGQLDAGQAQSHTLPAGKGLYIFVLDGTLQVGQQSLSKRDGYGVWNTSSIEIEATEGSEILLIEVPMAI